jgi:hypothetical protein
LGRERGESGRVDLPETERLFNHEEHESHEEIDPLQLRAKRLGAL